VALHLLLFSSDQRTASELGQLLAESDIEVEICSEILLAVEELTTRKFDAIISDWDEGAEGSFLIRTVRELKCTRDCLTIALVSDAAGSTEAIRSGAHSVIHRPIAADEIGGAISAMRDFMASGADTNSESHNLLAVPKRSTKATANLTEQPLSPPPPSPADFRAIAEANKPKAVPEVPKRKRWSELQALRPLPPTEPASGTVFGGPSPEESDKPNRKGVRLAVWSAMLLGCAWVYTCAPETSYSERIASVVLSAVDQATTTPEPELIRPAEDDFAMKATPVLTRHLLRSLTPVPPQPSQNLPQEWIEESDQNGEVVVPPAGYEQTMTASTGSQQAKPQPSMETPNSQLPESLKAPVLTASGRLGGIAPPNGLPNLLQPIVLSEELARKLLVSHTAPLYPEQALRSGIQGAVVLEAFIGKDGNISDLKLVRGPLLLGHAAFDAVKQWRFQPYVFNGQPTEAETLITISFRLPSIGQNLQRISSATPPTAIEAR
jgi:periplasmic protein TonB